MVRRIVCRLQALLRHPDCIEASRVQALRLLCTCCKAVCQSADAMLLHRQHKAPPRPAAVRIYEAHVGMSSEEPKVASYTYFKGAAGTCSYPRFS